MKTIIGSHNGHTYKIIAEYSESNHSINRPYHWFDGVRLNPTEAIWTEIVARELALNPQPPDEAMVIHIAKTYIDAKWGQPPSP